MWREYLLADDAILEVKFHKTFQFLRLYPEVALMMILKLQQDI